jgi:type I restriction enzyme S subunit
MKNTTETQRLESLYQQKLAALDALKKSLLHQAPDNFELS